MTNALLTSLLGIVILAAVVSTSAPGVIDLLNGRTTFEKVASDTIAEVQAYAVPEEAPAEPASSSSEASDPKTSETRAAVTASRPDKDKRQMALQAKSDNQAMSSSLMGIDFDLATPNAISNSPTIQPGNLVAVQKSVFANGAELGSLTVQIDPAAKPFLNRAELKELLDRAGVSTTKLDARGSADLLSFNSVREAGIDLRYDPVNDSIKLNL